MSKERAKTYYRNRSCTFIDQKTGTKYSHDWKVGKNGAPYVIHLGQKIYRSQMTAIRTKGYPSFKRKK